MLNKVTSLTVKYSDLIVGYLVETSEGNIVFQYDDNWVLNGFSISPLSLPLGQKVYISKNDIFSGLFGVFQDSLPDGWGALVQYRFLVKNGITPERLIPLTKLSLVDTNGLGALSYLPTQFAEPNISTDANLDSLASKSITLYENISNQLDLDYIYKFGGSSGGARPKVHIKDNDGMWIVKFPCSFEVKDAGVDEFRMNQLAKECGISVNEHKLFSSKICSGFFGAKRFDRLDSKRIHMISLSSILETSHRIPNLDYIHLFQVISKICADKGDIIEAYRRMCFNVLACNRDDHGRNFAFIYDEDINGYRLSPAYDLTYTPNKREHEMTVNGNGIPTEKDLLDVGEIIKIPKHKCTEIIGKIKRVL